MERPRMLVGGAALALLLVGVGGVQWYRSAAPPPPVVVTPPGAAQAQPAAGAPSPRPAAPRAAPAVPTADLRPPQPSPNAPPESGSMMVHVVGAVRHPGLYRLHPKARLADALHAAGGPRTGADLEAVNLASFVQDGEQVRVPTLA